MIVLDASALLETLLRTPAADAVDDRLFKGGRTLHVPHRIDVEGNRVIRRDADPGKLDERRGRLARVDLEDFPIRRYPPEGLLSRLRDLRGPLTAYDAAYAALAEALDAALLRRDRPLAAAAAAATLARVEVA